MSTHKNDVVIIRRNPLSPESKALHFASIGHGVYRHGRVTVEILWQGKDESASQFRTRAERRAEEWNAQEDAQ